MLYTSIHCFYKFKEYNYNTLKLNTNIYILHNISDRLKISALFWSSISVIGILAKSHIGATLITIDTRGAGPYR